MSLVFEKVSQPLAAAEKWIIGIAGSFLRLSECQWPVTVVLIKENRIVGEMKNMLAGDYARVDFDAVWIINGASPQVVGMQISAGGAGSNRVLGEVSVIDGGKSRTLANGAFITAGGVTAVAAQFSRAQLWNPAGSGKNVIVKQVSYGAYAQMGVSVHVSAVMLANAAAFSPISKMGGGAAGVALSKYDNAGAATVNPKMAEFYPFPAAGGQNVVLQEPIVLPPGYGMVVEAGSPNIGISYGFEWIEEGI